jgi:hypothetical protein
MENEVGQNVAKKLLKSGHVFKPTLQTLSQEDWRTAYGLLVYWY